MALQLLWSERARDDLEGILDFIASENRSAALDLRRRIDEAIIPALEHPFIYRAGRLAGTREIVAHPNYIVIYRVLAERIVVTAVIHARQEYP